VSALFKSHSFKENRWITLGTSAAGRILVVNHTFPDVFLTTFLSG